MTGNLFKNRSYTNGTAVFVHTYLGHDDFGNGTREYPYRSISKAVANMGGRANIVFRGCSNAYFSYTGNIIGDDINQVMLYIQYSTNGVHSISNLTFDRINAVNNQGGSTIDKCICNLSTSGVTGDTNYTIYPKYSFFVLLSNTISQSASKIIHNCTIGTYTPWNASGALSNKNMLVYNNLTTSPTTGTYWVFSSRCTFTGITKPNFTNNSKGNIQLLRDAYGNQSLFTKDIFGNETFQVIKEECDGGSHPNIFNRYQMATGLLSTQINALDSKTSITLTDIGGDIIFGTTGKLIFKNAAGEVDQFIYTNQAAGVFTGVSQTFSYQHLINETCIKYGDVLDFTLNTDVRNEALWASDIGGYVGCFAPIIPANDGATVYNVGDNGIVTATAGDMMLYNADKSLSFQSSTSGLQKWNRLSTNELLTIPKGAVFKGGRADSTDGSPLGFYFGKKQYLMTTNEVIAGGTLKQNTTYKVSNNTAFGITEAIIYGNSQILPYYFFNTKHIGTISVTAGSNIVTGAGTIFTKMFKALDTFTIPSTAGAITKTITSVDSDTQMVMNSTYAGALTAVPYQPPLTFSKLNAGSTTKVIEIANTPMQSMEVIPYEDDGITQSLSQHKFSAPFSGNVMLLNYTATGATRFGKTTGDPVLFAHLDEAQFIADYVTPVPTKLAVATGSGALTTITVVDASSYPNGTGLCGRLVINGVLFNYTSRSGNVFTGPSQTIGANSIDTDVFPYNLSNDKIAYYKGTSITDGWQISNADQEYGTLSLCSFFTSITPALSKVKLEINGHFDVGYDY